MLEEVVVVVVVVEEVDHQKVEEVDHQKVEVAEEVHLVVVMTTDIHYTHTNTQQNNQPPGCWAWAPDGADPPAVASSVPGRREGGEEGKGGEGKNGEGGGREE